MPQLKLGNLRDIPQFSKDSACYEKYLKDNTYNSLYLTLKIRPRIFVLGHYLFLRAHRFLELCSRKIVRFAEQIMSADKYPTL